MSSTGIDLATYKDRFRQVASERQVPEAEVEAFLAVMRPRVALHEEANDGGVVFRYGGLPRLPEGVEWPGGASFLGTLDCAALPHGELDLPYPESGRLLFFWGGEASWGDCWGEVIYVADSSTTSLRQPPYEAGDVPAPVDYFATPQVRLPYDTGWYDDVAFDGLEGIAETVEKTFAEVFEQFTLGGFPNTEAGPEWDKINESPYAISEQEAQQNFALLRSQYRVLLLSDWEPRDQSRINYVIRTGDLAAHRFDTVEMFAEVGH